MATTEEQSGSLYAAPVVNPPTVGHVKKLAEKWKFDLTEEEVKDYTDSITGMLAHYEKVYRMVEPKPPVKYPRVPGYRPPPEENKYNAWYVKTDIQGATSGKLFGKTMVVKDSICVGGVQMMNGSKLLEGYIPEFDATVVTRALDAGGRIVGKAACESFCFSGNSFTCDTGPVLNPHDTTRSSGGSSSGCGALLAAGEVDLAIGADQGGSIRIPSSWSGVVGFKPTYGLIPYTGGCVMDETLDQIGPMAQNVTDCALLLEVLAGPDGMDSRQLMNLEIPEYSKLLKSDVTGVKIGLLKEGFDVCSDRDAVEVVNRAVKELEKGGATLEEVSVPMHLDGHDVWAITFLEGYYENLVLRGGAGPSYQRFHSHSMMKHLNTAIKARPQDFSVTTKLLVLMGDFIKETNNYEFYCRCVNLTRALTAAYDKVLEKYDVLVMPTLPYKAPKLPKKGTRVEDLKTEAFSMVKNTCPFNSSGHPALSINAGFTAAENLPVGMMIVGKKWHEQDVLNVAYAYELIRDQTK